MVSDFHYVRTPGPDGGVDAAEGPAIGIELDTVLDAGLPPFNVALRLIAAVAEILAIAEEDGVVHGDIEPEAVLLDDTGAVSLEGFDRRKTQAPEGTPVGPATDRFGLGVLAYCLLSPRDLPPLPRAADAFENSVIDAVLAVNLEGMDESLIPDLQWFLVRLLSFRPDDRPPTVDTWRAFESFAERCTGPGFVSWCDAATDGGGERRDEAAASRPMPIGGQVFTGPLKRGSLEFDQRPADGPSTGWWTRAELKDALQRAMTSDYLADPDTGWMPGTPIPTYERGTGPQTDAWRVHDDPSKRPKRAATPRYAVEPVVPTPPAPDSTFSPDYAPADDPRASLRLAPPSEDARTVRDLPPAPSIPLPKGDAPTLPVPESPTRSAPARPSRTGQRKPPADPDTQPEFQHRPKAPEPDTPTVTAQADPTPPPAPSALAASAPRPIPAPDLSRGPDPFADIAETKDSNLPMLLGVGALVLVATVLCVGVTGMGGLAAFFGEVPGIDDPAVATAPDPAEDLPEVSKRAGRRVPKVMPVPTTFRTRTAPTPTPVAPAPIPTPRVAPAPAAPAPVIQPPPLPVPVAPLPTIPAPAAPAPTLVRPRPEPAPPRPAPTPAPFASPVPAPVPAAFPTPVPAPVRTGTPSLPNPGSELLPTLLPAPTSVPGAVPSPLRSSMQAHFTLATAARDAVIIGDPETTRELARQLEFLQEPDDLPPSWAPYLTDLRMEAWLMGNSPDLGAAGHKIAQIASACENCHRGVQAGPVIDAGMIPPRTFPYKDVMRKHAWAVDWMWVGLITGDDEAWTRGAADLSTAPIASAVLDGFPEPRFVELEGELHEAAQLANKAETPVERASTYGEVLATCARCHVSYRKP